MESNPLEKSASGAFQGVTDKGIQRVYMTLTFFNTLAGSFIWGINTLFLLNGGLSKTQAFAANAFFTAGMVLFDIPTGVVADTLGRRMSYLLGSATLVITTLIYFFLWKTHAPFLLWALDSLLLGLGFTFFSGSTDAWLVDALNSVGFTGALEDIFGKTQIVSGIALFCGATLGGIIAQSTNLGVPYLIRSGLLALTFIIAALTMRDMGFTPRKPEKYWREVKTIFSKSVEGGIRIPAMRWVMFIALVMSGVGIYGFYAAQPYLLELFGKKDNYTVAGLAASLIGFCQMAGGFFVPVVRRFFKRRTTVFTFLIIGSVSALCLFGLVKSFFVALVFLCLWGLLGSIMEPMRQSYLNKAITSANRATILSFDSVMGSAGGVVVQPLLGKTADAWSFATSFVVAGLIQLLALPFIWLARRQNSQADLI